MFSLSDRSLYLADLDLWIDSQRPRTRCYVSHGHADHARPHEVIVTTPRSARICRSRFGKRAGAAGVHYELRAYDKPWSEGEHRLTLFSAGHVLGSSQLLVENERGRFVYTGDFSLEPSYTSEPPEVRRADVVLMECTYGRPQYTFPPRAEVEGAMVAWARRALEAGAVPVFYAYSLGKAQEAHAILGRAGIPLALHGAIATIAEIYADEGIALPPYERYDPARFDGTCALLWPPSGRALPHWDRARPRRTASLTGWSAVRSGFWRGDAEVGFPLSSHADFPALVRYVELAQPKKVLLTHGYRDFERRLRALGIDAEYLEERRQLELFA
ncbi:MAG: MBL fold metallo-hydrolase RNA specificity domain-containing protein [Vulcanimicrobiaceae bacterium]